MKQTLTEIILCVDRSGSMQNIAADMQGGLRHLVAEQAAQPGECVVTYARFDNEYEVVFTARPAKDINLEDLKIEPRGNTALLDAMARSIDEAGSRFAAMPDEDRPAKVMLVIITDGQENASKETTHAQVIERIARQRDQYGWDIVYLGANQDAIKVGATFGMRAADAVTYDATSKGVHAMTAHVTTRATSYRSS